MAERGWAEMLGKSEASHVSTAVRPADGEEAAVTGARSGRCDATTSGGAADSQRRMRSQAWRGAPPGLRFRVICILSDPLNCPFEHFGRFG